MWASQSSARTTRRGRLAKRLDRGRGRGLHRGLHRRQERAHARLRAEDDGDGLRDVEVDRDEGRRRNLPGALTVGRLDRMA